MELNLTEWHWIKFCMYFIQVIHLDKYYSLSYYLFYKKYYDWLLPLLRKFFLIPNGVNKFIDLKMNYHTSCFMFIFNKANLSARMQDKGLLLSTYKMWQRLNILEWQQLIKSYSRGNVKSYLRLGNTETHLVQDFFIPFAI
jgi:hypothetical protein